MYRKAILVAMAALSLLASAPAHAAELYVDNFVPAATVGVATGVGVGLGISEGAITFGGVTTVGGAAAFGGVAGIGALALTDAALQPCRGFGIARDMFARDPQAAARARGCHMGNQTGGRYY
jgi:hypothetical protein